MKDGNVGGGGYSILNFQSEKPIKQNLKDREAAV